MLHFLKEYKAASIEVQVKITHISYKLKNREPVIVLIELMANKIITKVARRR